MFSQRLKCLSKVLVVVSVTPSKVYHGQSTTIYGLWYWIRMEIDNVAHHYKMFFEFFIKSEERKSRTEEPSRPGFHFYVNLEAVLQDTH